MSSILKRTVFVSAENDGTCKFEDWAQTITELGPCAEPFCPQNGASALANNTDKVQANLGNDEIQVIHEVRISTHEEAFGAINGGTQDPPIMGGHLWARDGR